MRQRIDVADLESATKIRAKYLRALENEDFGLLPGPTYVKSFLRTYAEKLGLDPQLLVEEYRAQYEPPEPRDFQPLASPPRDRRRRPPRPPVGRGAALVVAALALLGFLLVLGLTGGEDEPARQVDTGPGQTTAKPRADPVEKPAPKPAAAPKRVEVKVFPSEETYVCVDNGGAVVFEDTIDSPRSFRHKRRVRINVGKRSARVRVNGKRVAFADGPDPIGFDFTRGGRKQLPEAQRPCA